MKNTRLRSPNQSFAIITKRVSSKIPSFELASHENSESKKLSV